MTNIELYGVEDSVENRGGRTAGRIFAGLRRLFDYKECNGSLPRNAWRSRLRENNIDARNRSSETGRIIWMTAVHLKY